MRGDHTVLSIHSPVDAWAAPVLTVVIALLKVVDKRLLEPLPPSRGARAPFFGGCPMGKGWGSAGKESACIRFVRDVPQVELLGHMVTPCVILEEPPNGLAQRLG